MASAGRFVRSPQWWKHLRSYKRAFWKAERKAGKQDAIRQSKDKD